MTKQPKQLYIVTGANGHLGSTILRRLEQRNQPVRGLILPTESAADHGCVRYFHGDVRDRASLEPLFDNPENRELIVIHTAGIIDIASENVTPQMYDVNVNGTRNIADLCLEHHVKRLVHVSSVHAIPEGDNPLQVLTEVDSFSPDLVTGGYAKTKAEASQMILDFCKQGLDAVIVHPSGILGPYDASGNHLVQMVRDYMEGKLPACVEGGYDFVDVRDVADGCLSAAEFGRTGECYILSNRYYSIADVLKMVKIIEGGRVLPVLPMWLAKAAAPIMGWVSKLRRERPLYTPYSLYTLSSNSRFSHDKATRELHYLPRDLFKTIADTAAWLKKCQKKEKKKTTSPMIAQRN